MCDTVISQENTEIVRLFRNMQFSGVIESDSLALSWLKKHQNAFFGFVDGCWLNKEAVEKEESAVECHKICDSFSKTHLCDVFTPIDNKLFEFASERSAAAFKSWSSLDAESRSRLLFKVAQTIEKNQELFAIVEAVSSAKQYYKAKEDIPNLIETFYYYAGCALKLKESSESNKWFPKGPVCVVAEEYNNPSLVLSLRVCSALASGNSVLLLADVKSSLSSFLLAEICSESGLPAGVFNVIPINHGKFQTLGESVMVSKLVFTGTLDKSMSFAKLCSAAKLPCEFLVPRRSVVIVYEDADLYSAADGVLEALYFHEIRSKSGGCKVMVQESIRQKFADILVDRFHRIPCGRNLSKARMSCLLDPEHKKVLTPLIQQGVKINDMVIGELEVKIFHKTCDYPSRSPALFTKLHTTSRLIQEELGGPIIVTVYFRTAKESISMFNCDNKGSPVSIWTEKSSVALEVALKLKTGVIWVNSENVIDANAAFSGVYLSGNSVVGGKDEFYSHMSALPTAERNNKNDISLHSSKESMSGIVGIKEGRDEYKLYIGGGQKQTSNVKMLNENTLISFGSQSDLDSAVSSAVAAQLKWETLDDRQKRKFFIEIMEKLKKNQQDYVTELQKATGNSLDACQSEVSDAIAVLYFWITQVEKSSGSFQEIKKNYIVMQSRNPLGVIGIQCPDEKPFLSFVSLVIPAIAHGNAVVALASTNYPTPALKICEIFTSANIPGGVINVIWGNTSDLVPTLCKHTGVNAVWFSDVPSEVVYGHCNATQRQFHCCGIWNEINETNSLKFAMESTFIKSVFLPAGDIFAN